MIVKKIMENFDLNEPYKALEKTLENPEFSDHDNLIKYWHCVIMALIAETSKDFTIMINIQELEETEPII